MEEKKELVVINRFVASILFVFYLVAIFFFLFELASSQVIISSSSNNNGVKIIEPITPSTSGGSPGANVTSVSSSDNCILVNPNTGNVVLTFNVSCGGIGTISFIDAYGPFINVYNNTGPNTYIDFDTAQGNATWVAYENAQRDVLLGFNNISAWGGSFEFINSTGNLTLFEVSGGKTGIRVGRSLSDYFNIQSDDGNVYLTQYQDQDEGGTHRMIFDLRITGAGQGNYSINKSTFSFKLNGTEYYSMNQSGFMSQNNMSILNTLFARYLSGDGSQITNVTSTVGQNSTLLHCSNVTGNSLCPTGTPTFAGLLSNGKVTVDTLLSEWLKFTSLGGVLQVGHITSENSVYQFEPFGGYDMYVGNCSRSCFQMGDLGVITVSPSSSYIVTFGALRGMEINTTKTIVYNNLTIRGSDHNINGNLNFSNFGNISNLKYLKNNTYSINLLSPLLHNGTGNVNITSNETGYPVPTYTWDITATTAFDTTYNNTLDRSILIEFGASADGSSLGTDTAQMTGNVGGVDVTANLCFQSTDKLSIRLGCHGTMVVPKGRQWQIKSVTGGGGSITLDKVMKTTL